jgi:hypothetical protein
MALQKIKEDIAKRSISKNIGYFPQTGGSKQEYGYRYCKSEMKGMEDNYFVVSKIIRFTGSSITDFGYNVYVYDKNGNYIDDPVISEKCKGAFFETLNDVTE